MSADCIIPLRKRWPKKFTDRKALERPVDVTLMLVNVRGASIEFVGANDARGKLSLSHRTASELRRHLLRERKLNVIKGFIGLQSRGQHPLRDSSDGRLDKLLGPYAAEIRMACEYIYPSMAKHAFVAYRFLSE
jgi:hypothetical protein